MERLQKVIANRGIASRRKAEELIVDGKVKVNGKVVKELGTKVSGTDIITVNDVVLPSDIKKEYYLLNKPRGVITSCSDNLNRKTVVDYIDTDARIYPVGRLDYDTTGLVILTNDGEFASILMHPKNKVEKIYVAKVEGLLTKDDISKLKTGVIVDSRKVDILKFKILKKDYNNNTTTIELTIIEGRNHIVKRIFETLKHPVIKLSRIGIDFLRIDGMKSGEYRSLSIKEVKKLYSKAQHGN